ARFFKERLRVPDPPVDVAKYLERSTSRRVSKIGEVSYNGYKIQVTLPAHSRVIVVETIETIRIEYGGGLHREIKRHDLMKETHVKRQDGLDVAKEDPPAKLIPEPVVTEKPLPRKLKVWDPDKDGLYHRRINPQGYFECMTIKYFVGKAHAGKPVLVQVVDNKLHVFNEQKAIIRTLEKRGMP
nr:hypothetical protein [Candidatus Sigynarchaeota archaeon]